MNTPDDVFQALTEEDKTTILEAARLGLREMEVKTEMDISDEEADRLSNYLTRTMSP